MVLIKAENWWASIPGSPEAKAKGCTCPDENQRIAYDTKMFWVNCQCPLHYKQKDKK